MIGRRSFLVATVHVRACLIRHDAAALPLRSSCSRDEAKAAADRLTAFPTRPNVR